MRDAAPLLLLGALAACATTSEPGTAPSRTETAAAVKRWRDCVLRPVPGPIPDLTCSSAVRNVRVTSLRCRADAAQAQARTLCRFRSVIEPRGGGPAEARGPECAWLVRDEGGEWWIDNWPDADLCEF